jgi:outer membrane receptor protein involved in Fe transport
MLAGISGQAPDDRFNTKLTTANQTLGLYFSDTFSANDRAHLTVSGRYNWTQLDIADLLGTSLNGTHEFRRFNPGIGGVYQVNDAVAVFGQYTESNRAPVAAELSCADPAEPCRVPNAFVSDPPLRQAVGRSFEGGLRGRSGARNRAYDWSVAAYRTRIADDILFVASPKLIGTGFFQNAGDTQRLGVEVDLSGEMGNLRWYGSYGFVDASFESVLALPGDEEVNDAATESGEVQVTPGDRLPGIPRHSFKAGVQQEWSESWYASLEGIVESNRVFVGDEGNDQRALNGYGILNFYASYRFGRPVELFVRMDNLLNRQYETFGVLAETEIDLREVPEVSDPRFVGPGRPRTFVAGMQFNF